MKNEANECKMFKNYIPWLFYCQIDCKSSANLYRVRENHARKFRFCSSSFFLSSSSFANELNSKTIACVQIVNIPNDCSATWHLPFLGPRGVRATTGELRPRNCRLLSPQTLRVLGHRLLVNYFGRGTYAQATPGLLSACLALQPR